MVEHRVRNAGVVSSNLIRSTMPFETAFRPRGCAGSRNAFFVNTQAVEIDMPKQKTHKGAAQRCKVTGTGKVIATRAGKRHLAECKTRKRKRNLRGMSTTAKSNTKMIRTLLSPA